MPEKAFVISDYSSYIEIESLFTIQFNQNKTTYTMTTQTKAVEYKQCPSNHYLSLCDSSLRSFPTCNVCHKSRLIHSWTCFPCDYDMCLSCYDNNNNRPTKMVKVCNKRHLLVYSDSKQRQNVKCDKCYKTNFSNQFTCWVCNYDECMACYEGRSNNNNCNIF